MIRVNIKDILKEKRITMTQLHKETGISQNALSLLANGKSNGIQFNTLEKILSATGTKIEDLLEHIGEPFILSVELQGKKERKNCKHHKYKIIATDAEGIEYSAEISFQISRQDKMNGREFVLISYKESHLGFPYKLLNDLLFVIHDNEFLKIVSYLVAIDLFYQVEIKDLSLSSLILFSWFGFLPSNDGELAFTLPLISPNKEEQPVELDISIPDITNLMQLKLVDNVIYNTELKKHQVSIFLK